MRKFRRQEAPEFLKSRWERWGQDWQRRLAERSGASFHWHDLDGVPVNQQLLPTLKSQVQNHCSFCDNFPVSPPSNDTIEHFRPKTKFPLVAYQWENLYYCCDFCQGKGANFEEALLAPDTEEYVFEKFFRWDFTLGKLEVNEQASPEDQKRAEATIRLYRLNEGHPSLRRREMHRRSKMEDEPLDDFAYRNFIGGPTVEAQE